MSDLVTYRFEKDVDGRWYIDLPSWEGDRADLEMVMGADVMLDIISQHGDLAFLTISEDDFPGSNMVLTFDREDVDGGWYNLTTDHYNFPVWLCQVTKFVFGHLPDVLYCKY